MRGLIEWTVGFFVLALAGDAAGQCEMNKLMSVGDVEGDEYGVAAAVDGDLAVVGACFDDTYGAASGSAYVYRYENATWVQDRKIFGRYAAAGDEYGLAVAADDEWVAVGMWGDDDNGSNAGAVRAYRLDMLNTVGKLMLASDGAADDGFGYSVGLIGTPGAAVAVVGAPGDDDLGSRSGSAYVFRYDGSEWIEAAKLTASDGGANDGFGTSVAIGGVSMSETIIVGAPGDDDFGSSAGAVYVYTFDGVAWNEKKIVASDADAGDDFGTCVALTGPIGAHRALVGAPGEDAAGPNAGAAYVLRQSSGTWGEEAKLVAADTEAGDGFGEAVDISNYLAVIGAKRDDDLGADAGAAYVFRFNGSTWEERQKVKPADGKTLDQFGCAVAASHIAGDDVAFVGARRQDGDGADAGAAYVFHGEADVWTQRRRFGPTDGDLGQEFGYDVDVDGDFVVVGAWGYDMDTGDPGSAFFFERDGANWIFRQEVEASTGAPDDLFAESVAIDGKVAVMGARRHSAAGEFAGAAFVFRYDGSSWTEEQRLLASDGKPHDVLGNDVAVGGPIGSEVVVVTATGDDEGTGAAYVFRRDGGAWIEEAKLVASDGKVEDHFGRSVAISKDGEIIVVGASSSDQLAESCGSVYVFRRTGSTWTEEQILLPADLTEYVYFGADVAISGDRIVSGAYRDSTMGGYAGAAYVFRWNGSTWIERQKLFASDAEAWDLFGNGVAIENDVILVGATQEEEGGSLAGAVYVFLDEGGGWGEQYKLVPERIDDGGTLGLHLGLSGGYAVAGARGDDDNGSNAGAAYVFGGFGDCNDNDVLDCAEIMAGAPDVNGDLVLDECACPADLDGTGAVDFGDLLLVLSRWNALGGPEDLDGDGFVGFGDLLIVLATWGDCP